MSFKHQTQSWAALMAQTVKDLPVMQETRVQNLGQEDPRKKGMATHSSVLARGIPWTEELGGLQSLASQRARHDSVDCQLPTMLFWFEDTKPRVTTSLSCAQSKPRYWIIALPQGAQLYPNTGTPGSYHQIRDGSQNESPF